MKLQQLRYFIVACEEKSITRASKKLFISQPTISFSIRELEREFDVLLLNRKSQEFNLTDAGKHLYEEGRRLLDQANKLQQGMSCFCAHNQEIRLGVPAMAGAYILPILLSAYQNMQPKAVLKTIEAGSLSLLEELQQEKLDFAIVTDLEAPDCESIELYKSETMLYTSEKNPLSRQPFVTFEMLDDVPLVLFERNHHALSRKFEENFAEANAHMKVFCETSHVINMYQMISSGRASGFISDKLNLSIPNAVAIPFQPPMLTSVRLLWRRERKLNPDMKKLCNICSHFSEYDL